MGSFVSSFGNVMNYTFGANPALVADCINRGIGNEGVCAHLAHSVGYTAGADAVARVSLGLGGVALGAIGLEQAVSIFKGETWKQKSLRLLQAGSTLGLSAAAIGIAYLTPVATIDGQGSFSLGAAPLQ